ncbi:transforming growth factor-beta receptor-associated protein 1-like [Corticium candelabrum]|uniref:transforming growth factor-beta receptor-associated protein 1-like n=1 Tax=Corticium candelabrum TaxID=121492 RepID=UPI002E260FDB|nr:transforming growth factor-beta receptor-associated protein 1-like [Corticium candelabrum]
MSLQAFDLVYVIEQFMVDRPKTTIECMDCYEDSLYIGTSDCFVMHYKIQETISPTGKIHFRNVEQSRKSLGAKKAISQILLAPILGRLLVLFDGTLFLMKMNGLEFIDSGLRLRNVTAICRNESLDSSTYLNFEVCVAVARKKAISIYTLTDEKILPSREVTLSDSIVQMVRDGPTVCLALTGEYCLVNIHTETKSEICPLNTEMYRPVMKRVNTSEFLIRQKDLGVIVDEKGIAKYQPMDWRGLDVVGLAYSFPYILAMSGDKISVYSMLDKERKQTIPFQGGKVIGDYNEKVYVATEKQVYMLSPVTFEKQVHSLFSQRRLSEGLLLARVGFASCLDEAQQRLKMRQCEQQVGFAFLADGEFEQAVDHFKEGEVDVRELICLFPDLKPQNFDFHSEAQERGLHSCSDIKTIVKKDKKMLANAKHFLRDYLCDVRTKPSTYGKREIVDTVLLKLYAEDDAPELQEFIMTDNHCAQEESRDFLFAKQRFYALGLMYCYASDASKALEIWVKVVDGELIDDSHPGFEYVVKFLSSLSDHEIVLKYAKWALDKNQELAATIFTNRPVREKLGEHLHPEFVVNFLTPYVLALRLYLEYLVFTRKLDSEKHHTQLALLYLDEVLQLRSNSTAPREKLQTSRHQLKRLLEQSSLYRVSVLLSRLKDTDLHAECAILYGKMGEHRKALDLLVHRVKDYRAAEKYCQINAMGKDRGYRQRLYLELLQTYLQPEEKGQRPLTAPAVDLLNSHTAEFDAAQVMKLIPEDWSIGVISAFLTHSLRKNLSLVRTTRIQQALERATYSHMCLQHQHSMATVKPVTIAQERECHVCRKPFNDATVVRYPNGVTTHLHCGRNREVCPVTGKRFIVNKPERT